MAVISYIDDNHRLVKAVIERNYSSVNNYIESLLPELDYCVRSDSTLIGYKISRNNPVSGIYGFDVYVVRFYAINASTMHSEFQEIACKELLDHLKNRMSSSKGYYNMRMPTHIVDLIRAFNSTFNNMIFCGGTVEQYTNSECAHTNNRVHVFMADSTYIKEHAKRIEAITIESFASYLGQYHLSYVTSAKAGDIYENWVKSSLLSGSTDRIVVAEYGDEIAGYLTINESENAFEGILASVDPQIRGIGAYKSMIAFTINYAHQNGKAFISSTQFDNFSVQAAWNSLGMRPFYSIYNFHFDMR